MTDNIDPDVAQLSRDVVKDLAPNELPLFGAVSRAYAKNPEQAEKVIKSKDEVLGFGLEVGLLLTPAVIAVAEAVVRFLGAELLKLGEQAAGTAVDTTVHNVLSHTSEAKQTEKARAGATASLTSAQLAEVRKVAINRAISLHLPRDQAERLADAMVARLAVAPG